MKIKALLYTTKQKPYLVKRNILTGVEPIYLTLKENVEDKLNGKIVAECDYEVEEIGLVEIPDYAGDGCYMFVSDVNIYF